MPGTVNEVSATLVAGDNTPPAMGLEDPVLLAVGQAGVQRQHFGMAQIQLIQRLGGIANFPLTAHKDQDIAGPFAPQFIDGIKKIACS